MWKNVKGRWARPSTSTCVRTALWLSLRYIVVLAVLSALCGVAAGVWISLLVISLAWLLRLSLGP